MSNEFEKALDAFLEGAEADEAHQALYDIIRAAFLAGWRWAGSRSNHLNNEINRRAVFRIEESRPSFFAPFSGKSARKGQT